MPALASRGKGRRTINEINMVPFIDVMLVLLIIFMVTAPMLTPGMVDVPSVGKGKNMPKVVGHIIVEKTGELQFKTPDATRTIGLGQIGETAKAWQDGQPPETTAVVISAEKTVQYEAVVKVMDALQRAKVQRVGLAVKQTGS